MPFLDRNWWLRVLLACGTSAIALAYMVWCIRSGLSIPPDSQFIFGPSVLLFAIVIPMPLFHLTRYAVIAALPARRRARLAAIRGDQTAHQVVNAERTAPKPCFSSAVRHA